MAPRDPPAPAFPAESPRERGFCPCERGGIEWPNAARINVAFAWASFEGATKPTTRRRRRCVQVNSAIRTRLGMPAVLDPIGCCQWKAMSFMPLLRVAVYKYGRNNGAGRQSVNKLPELEVRSGPQARTSNIGGEDHAPPPSKRRSPHGKKAPGRCTTRSAQADASITSPDKVQSSATCWVEASHDRRPCQGSQVKP